ncbi:MAG: hypothetical protein N2485_05365 [bacterium]|nr:hypothetical protein [bacterium]
MKENQNIKTNHKIDTKMKNTKVKNIKVRTCIICFNKFTQEELIRLFVAKNDILVITFKDKIILINYIDSGSNNELNDVNILFRRKELMKSKSRSIYFCFECIIKNDINKIQKRINNYFSKLKKMQKLKNLEKLKIYLENKKSIQDIYIKIISKK